MTITSRDKYGRFDVRPVVAEIAAHLAGAMPTLEDLTASVLSTLAELPALLAVLAFVIALTMWADVWAVGR